MTSDFEGFLSQILFITFLTILILEKEPVFPFFNVECQTRELLWYDAVLDWGLNPGPPALNAITIPLGYRGGGVENDENDIGLFLL